MLSRELATSLRRAGVHWSPAKGDRFMIPDRDLDDEVFVVSDMVVEAVDLPRVGRILAFNGTTEWALDSVEAAEAIWLPREEQLRSLLGDAFVSLERLETEPAGYAVTVRVAGELDRHVDVDAEAALGPGAAGPAHSLRPARISPVSDDAPAPRCRETDGTVEREGVVAMAEAGAVPDLRHRAAGLGWLTAGLALLTIAMLAVAVWLVATGSTPQPSSTVVLPVNVDFSHTRAAMVVAAATAVAATFLGLAAAQTASAMKVLSRDRHQPPPMPLHLRQARQWALGPLAARILDPARSRTGRSRRCPTRAGSRRGRACAARC